MKQISRIHVPDWLRRVFLAQPIAKDLYPEFLGNVLHPVFEPECASSRFSGSWFQIDEQVGAANDTILYEPASGVIPEGEYRWVMAAEMFHNGAAAQSAMIGVEHIGLARRIRIAQNTALATNVELFTERPFLVPPGFQVRFSTGALSAGAAITARIIWCRYETGLPHPSL